MENNDIAGNLIKQKFLNLYKNTENFIPQHIKHQAVTQFTQLPFPTHKTESWKYTDTRPLLEPDFTKAKPLHLNHDIVSRYHIPDLQANILVFINGYFSASNSKIISQNNGLIVCDMASAQPYNQLLESAQYGLNATLLDKNNVFAALNTAFATGGALIVIPANTQIEHPIHIINLTNADNGGSLVQQRNLIFAHENSNAHIVQSYHSTLYETTFSNLVTEIFMKSDATICYDQLQCEGNGARQINITTVHQYKGSNFMANTFTFCGKLVRNELSIHHKGAHCQTQLNGLYLADHQQIIDNQIYIDHANPHCTSRQLYKGVIDQKAEAIFSGKVYVARNAQQTDAQQNNKNILLSQTAKVHSKPQLEIYADDVKCSHGSTTGQLDQNALFYLRARGIGKEQARRLILFAFAVEVAQHIKLSALRNLVEFLIEQRLNTDNSQNQCTLFNLFSTLKH